MSFINCNVTHPDILKAKRAQAEEIGRRIEADRKGRRQMKSKDIKHVLVEEPKDKPKREVTVTRRKEK